MQYNNNYYFYIIWLKSYCFDNNDCIGFEPFLWRGTNANFSEVIGFEVYLLWSHNRLDWDSIVLFSTERSVPWHFNFRLSMDSLGVGGDHKWKLYRVKRVDLYSVSWSMRYERISLYLWVGLLLYLPPSVHVWFSQNLGDKHQWSKQ